MTEDSRLQEFLSLLKNVEKTGGGWKACCPAHDDNVQSLSISRGDTHDIVMKCFAGCDVPDICYSVGKTVSWLFGSRDKGAKKGHSSVKGNLVAEFDYVDADGALVYQSLRYEYIEDGKREKTFRQRRPDGKGGWIYKLGDVKKVLYRLPELIKAHPSQPVLIVEGEKHVDKLREMGFVATCNVGGGGGKNNWLKDFSKYLTDRDVVILPDNDKTGREHGNRIAEKLKGAAKSIRFVELPNLPPKGDILDWLAAGGTADKLRALMDKSLEELPQPEPGPQLSPEEIAEQEKIASEKCCEAIGLFVYGEDEQRRVKVFSKFHRKSDLIRELKKLTYVDLLQICGPKISSAIERDDDKDLEKGSEGKYKLRHIKESIATICGYRRTSDDSEVGIGVWEGSSGKEGAGRDSIVLVNAGEAAVLNGEPQLRRHPEPQYGDLFLDLGSSSSWFDFDEIDHYLRNYTVEWAQGVVDEADNLFSKWQFPPGHQAIAPPLLTGLVIASWVQAIWRWRPQVFIYGKSASGKSTLFRTLSGDEGEGTFGLFGRLAMASGDVSAAGVAQALSSTSRIAVLDELERSPHRKALMQMLRNSGGGSRKIRGSTHHKAVEFKLRHLVWAAATETGLKQEPDTNRFIAIELIKPPDSKMGSLDIPEDEELQRLGYKLLAIALKTVHAARELVERLKAVKPIGYHARVVETYAVPAACYAMAAGMDFEQAVGVHAEMLATHDIDSIESDEERLVDQILSSIIRIKESDGWSESTVGQALERHDFDATIGHELEKYGIAVVTEPPPHRVGTRMWIDGEEKCVFFATGTISNHLLKHSEWTDANIGQILSREDGALRGRMRVAGRQARGVLLKYSTLITADKPTQQVF